MCNVFATIDEISVKGGSIMNSIENATIEQKIKKLFLFIIKKKLHNQIIKNLFPIRYIYDIINMHKILKGADENMLSQFNKTWNHTPYWRKFLLWGTDSENNPSYIIFYGLHYCKKTNGKFFDNVQYTNYIIFRGNGGHMPSFQSTIIYENPKNKYKLYYKKDCRNYYGWRPLNSVKNNHIEDFKLIKKHSVKLPYFQTNSYEDYYNAVKDIEFENFTLAKNPEDVFKIDNSLDILYDLFSNDNIYTRKKVLKQLLSTNPTKSLYEHFLKIGSCELISGLFLELAKANNDIILSDAKEILSSQINWDQESYITGLKRCASIYVNTFENKNKRISYLKNSVSDFGLQLSKKDEISFKNVIQEAEIYKSADVIGKIAYGLETNQIKIIFRRSHRLESYRYYISYLKRIIKQYALSDEKAFIEVMKNIFSNYTNDIILTKTCFAEIYLGDNYAGLRHIWNNNLDCVIDISCESTNDYVLQKMFDILNDGANKVKLLHIQYDKLIKLANSTNEGLSNLAFNSLKVKLKKETTYNSELMYLLMKSTNPKVQELATNYYKLANGEILVEDLIHFAIIGDMYDDILKHSLDKINIDLYIKFLHELINLNNQTIFTDNIKQTIKNSIYKLQTLQLNQKADLLTGFINDVSNNTNVFINELIEDIIFSHSLNELNDILDIVQIDNLYSSFVGALLTAIKNKVIPNDGILLELFEKGSIKMIKCLVDVCVQNKNTLEDRQATLLIFMECDIAALNNLAINMFENAPKDKQKSLHISFLDSPVSKVHNFAIKKLYEIYEQKGEYIPQEFLIKMLEHTSKEVKSYASEKVNDTILNLGNGDKNLFIYYSKTILLMPNKLSKAKKNIYNVLPKFANMYDDKKLDLEDILLCVGSSNIILDSENALTTLAKIKLGVI